MAPLLRSQAAGLAALLAIVVLSACLNAENDCRPGCEGNTRVTCEQAEWGSTLTHREDCAQSGEVCVREFGGGSCAAPQATLCNFCSDNASTLLEAHCTSAGDVSVFGAIPCDPGETCVSVEGVADCVLATLESCDPDTWPADAHCENNTVIERSCSANHYVAERLIPCDDGAACTEKDGWADCCHLPLEPCTGEFQGSCQNNVTRVAACNSIGYVEYVQLLPCEGGLVCEVQPDGSPWCVMPAG